MEKQTIAIIMGIFLISIATAYYSGETEVFNLGEPIINCSIYNNHSNMEGLNLTWNGTEVIIVSEVNYQTDNFTIGCWTIKTRWEEDVVSSGGGGGSRPNNDKYVEVNETIEVINDTEDNSWVPWNENEEVEVELEEENHIVLYIFLFLLLTLFVLLGFYLLARNSKILGNGE